MLAAESDIAMKRIEKDELYENLSQFLKTKGIEFKEGGYTKGIHAGCSFLAEAINLSQRGLERARQQFDKGLDQIDKGLDQMRQVIHEKTAPKPPPHPGAARSQAAKAGNPRTKAARRRPSKRKRKPSVRRGKRKTV